MSYKVFFISFYCLKSIGSGLIWNRQRSGHLNSSSTEKQIFLYALHMYEGPLDSGWEIGKIFHLGKMCKNSDQECKNSAQDLTK